MSKQGHSQEQIDRKLQSIERWKDTITRYKKQVQEINDSIVSYRQINNLNVMESKRDLLRNNVQIAEHNIRILESELMIDKIRKKNYKIKAQHDNAEVLDVTV